MAVRREVRSRYARTSPSATVSPFATHRERRATPLGTDTSVVSWADRVPLPVMVVLMLPTVTVAFWASSLLFSP